jgi:alpha-amylase
VHQPHRLLPADPAQRPTAIAPEDDATNAAILSRVAENCYLPANRMFQRLIAKHAGRFRISLSLSGTVIAQMKRHRPDVLESFQQLVAGGGVELIAEPYHHSLAFLHSPREFDRQVELHLQTLEELFHIRPRVFRNTELIYNDDIAAKAETMGFDGILTEGVDRALKGRSPNFPYRAPQTARIKTLVRNSWLSDDLGFRFSDPTWPDHPLTPEKYASWLADSPGDLINLFLGYESLGEHQPATTGIFDFWENLPDAVEQAGLQWVTPSEAVDLYRASHEYPCRFLTSWTDAERDLSAWTASPHQREALEKIHGLEKGILALNDLVLTDIWANLLTSNHFHWMSTKDGGSGSSRHLPYASPQEAHHRFMTHLHHFATHVCEKLACKHS